MATAPALMTIEQYLRTSYSPDVDFLEGEIEERSWGEFDHGRMQGLLFTWFVTRENQLRLGAAVEWRIRVKDNRVRICDMAAVRLDLPREQVALRPPIVCIEVLSPDDRLSRAEKVLADYLHMGVENIWLIDPIRRWAYVYDSNGLHHAPDNILTIKNTDAAVNVDELFASLDSLNT